jgi:ribosomal protein S27AE
LKVKRGEVLLMQQSCQKCGAEVRAEQAFCSKCGAVVGMGDAGGAKRDEWDMASTFVTKKPMTAPLSRPPATAERTMPTATVSDPGPAPVGATPAAAATKPARANNTLLFAVIGVVAVLLVGVLLLLLYMNSKG